MHDPINYTRKSLDRRWGAARDERVEPTLEHREGTEGATPENLHMQQAARAGRPSSPAPGRPPRVSTSARPRGSVQLRLANVASNGAGDRTADGVAANGVVTASETGVANGVAVYKLVHFEPHLKKAAT